MNTYRVNVHVYGGRPLDHVRIVRADDMDQAHDIAVALVCHRGRAGRHYTAAGTTIVRVK